MTFEIQEGVESMKPIVILQTGSMSKADIKLLRDNGLCVVEAKMPSAVRIMEPIPLNYSIQEQAAIELSRTLLKGANIGTCNHKNTVAAMYVDILLKGDALRRVPQVEAAKV